MEKIQLPQVTLCCLTGKGYKTKEHLDALWKSQQGIRFGEVKLIEIEWVKSINDWNEAIIYELPVYINTSFCLLIHSDGYVIHPEVWQEEWLQYDYIGAPWPPPNDSYSYRTPTGNLVRVGNSVSLRSKKLMDLVATRPMEYHYGNNNEDGQICVWERDWLEEQGCKFADLGVAKYFSKEWEIPENVGIKTFAFHSTQ